MMTDPRVQALIAQWRERVATCRRLGETTGRDGQFALSRSWAEEAEHISDCADELEALALSVIPASNLVVGGRMERSIADFIRACGVHLTDEQEKIAPDTALIAVLCDGVRMAREYLAYVASVIPSSQPFTENETKDVLTALYQDGHVDLVLCDRVAALMRAAVPASAEGEDTFGAFDKLRDRLALLRLAERGTDNGWIDDATVEQCRSDVLKCAIRLVRDVDAKLARSAGSASQDSRTTK
jgi:hypothetical protein